MSPNYLCHRNSGSSSCELQGSGLSSQVVNWPHAFVTRGFVSNEINYKCKLRYNVRITCTNHVLLVIVTLEQIPFRTNKLISIEGQTHLMTGQFKTGRFVLYNYSAAGTWQMNIV